VLSGGRASLEGPHVYVPFTTRCSAEATGKSTRRQTIQVFKPRAAAKRGRRDLDTQTLRWALFAAEKSASQVAASSYWSRRVLRGRKGEQTIAVRERCGFLQLRRVAHLYDNIRARTKMLSVQRRVEEVSGTRATSRRPKGNTYTGHK